MTNLNGHGPLMANGNGHAVAPFGNCSNGHAAAAEPLHIGVLPAAGPGHHDHFLELSKRLALLGCRVSFFSTNSELQLLNSPQLLSNLHVVPLSPSPTTSASPYAAYDSISVSLAAFLSSSTPPVDWLLCDYAPYWAPPIARSLNVKSAFISIYSAAAMAFLGPPQDLILNKKWPIKLQSDGLTVVPEWVHFYTPIAFKPHEVPRLPRNMEDSPDKPYPPVNVTDFYRFGVTIRDTDAVAIRSFTDLEQPQWFGLLQDRIFKKPVLPLGLFPPTPTPSPSDDQWSRQLAWLDRRPRGSVVYAAHGIGVILSKEEVGEIARGLELSGLPFVWALRWVEGEASPLPEGFEARVGDRGIVCKGWVPQVRFLAHPAIGGFLTNCGWSSVGEALQFGVPLILLSIVRDQKTNEKVLADRGVGKEVPREGQDRTFTAEGIAATVRMVVVEKEGELYRAKAKEMMGSIGDGKAQNGQMKVFVEYLKDHKPVRI